MAFLFVELLVHLEIKVGATKVGYCCKEFENILLHLQDNKDAGPCVSVP